MKNSKFNSLAIAVVIACMAIGFLGSVLVSCVKEANVAPTVQTEYPVFDLDKLRWEELKEADFGQAYIGFFRGNSEIAWIETRLFKDIDGNLILQEALASVSAKPGGLRMDCCGTILGDLPQACDICDDCNSCVNTGDLQYILANWGLANTCADYNSSGIIDTPDLLIWFGYYPNC